MEQILTKRRYFDIGLQIEELLYSGTLKLASDSGGEPMSVFQNQPTISFVRRLLCFVWKWSGRGCQRAGTYFIDSPGRKSIKSARLARITPPCT